MIIDSNIHPRIEGGCFSTRSCGAIIQRSVVLSEGKSLGPAKLGPASSLDLCESDFTGRFVLFCTHWDIVLRRAARVMIIKERAIASVKDVDFGVSEIGVAMSIACSVLIANVFRSAFIQQ